MQHSTYLSYRHTNSCVRFVKSDLLHRCLLMRKAGIPATHERDWTNVHPHRKTRHRRRARSSSQGVFCTKRTRGIKPGTVCPVCVRRGGKVSVNLFTQKIPRKETEDTDNAGSHWTGQARSRDEGVRGGLCHHPIWILNHVKILHIYKVI